MRTNDTLTYLFSDHLGSTSLTTNAAGNLLSQMKYKAWGEVRYSTNTTLPDYTYTGQYSHTADFGLMFYNARWYDPALGRFAQADSIVPGGAQGLDRYAYVNNNPLRYTDPTGHCIGLFTCFLTAVGALPDYQGIANVVLWTKTDNAVVAASIAVQSEFPMGVMFGDAHGLAQVKEDQKGLYGVDDKNLYNPSVAVEAMGARISNALEACTKCTTDTDNLILAAIAQNDGIIDF